MQLIDSHCHLDLDVFNQDRDDILSHCFNKGINGIVVPAIKSNGWDHLLTICKTHLPCLPALGLHPVFINEHRERDIDLLDEKLDSVLPVAVGEIGLDFFIKKLNQDKQILLFEKQLLLAQNHHLPVILHVRKAHDQVLQRLKRIPVKGGFVHAFNGSLQQADKYIELGFKLGFGGTLTWQHSHKIHQLAKSLPIESMVLESDAPDMTVSAHRGERNSPEYLTDCLQSLSEIKNMDLEDIALQTTKNASDVLNLDKHDNHFT